MKTPSDRLRDLRIAKGFENAADAARAFGWNEHTYKSHENGVRGMKTPVAEKYARAFGSTAGHILTGETASNGLPVFSTVSSVPLVGEAAAGMFRSGDWVPRDGTDIPAIPRKGISADRQYAVRVVGTSVNKRIPDGMYAICTFLDSMPGGAQMGSLVHVVRQDGDLFEHTIKELRFTSQGMVLMPVSDDPEHQEPIPLSSGEESQTHIHGVVIGVYQPI